MIGVRGERDGSSNLFGEAPQITARAPGRAVPLRGLMRSTVSCGAQRSALTQRMGTGIAPGPAG